MNSFDIFKNSFKQSAELCSTHLFRTIMRTFLDLLL